MKDFEEWAKTATEKQVQHLHKIIDLAEQERVLRENIREAKQDTEAVTEVRNAMGVLLKEAVELHNMGALGIIQRQYESYVGSPMPQTIAWSQQVKDF